jgi:hypothetical protein
MNKPRVTTEKHRKFCVVRIPDSLTPQEFADLWMDLRDAAKQIYREHGVERSWFWLQADGTDEDLRALKNRGYKHLRGRNEVTS